MVLLSGLFFLMVHAKDSRRTHCIYGVRRMGSGLSRSHAHETMKEMEAFLEQLEKDPPQQLQKIYVVVSDEGFKKGRKLSPLQKFEAACRRLNLSFRQFRLSLGGEGRSLLYRVEGPTTQLLSAFRSVALARRQGDFGIHFLGRQSPVPESKEYKEYMTRDMPDSELWAILGQNLGDLDIDCRFVIDPSRYADKSLALDFDKVISIARNFGIHLEILLELNDQALFEFRSKGAQAIKFFRELRGAMLTDSEKTLESAQPGLLIRRSAQKWSLKMVEWKESLAKPE